MFNIIIADDHDLVRDTIAAYLEAVDDLKVQTAENFHAAEKIINTAEQVDLVILDYNMPGMNGLDGIEKVKRMLPDCKVALMSGVANKDIAKKAMELGANGFIPKSLSAVSFVNAIKFLLLGERYFPFDFESNQTTGKAEGEFANLSQRELQTLEQLCLGLSNKEIAKNLDIQEVTVKLHVKNLLSKLGVTNRTQAALLARERQIF